MSHRLISNLCWIVSGLGIAAALAWIAVAEDKGTAILGGLAAVILARVLVGQVARWHEEEDAAKRREASAEPSDPEEDADNR